MEEENVPDLNSVLEELKGLGESIKGMNEQIVELQTKQTVPKTVVDPSTDPEMKPPENWKSLREEVRTEADRIADEKLQAKEAEEQERREVLKEAEKEWDSKYDQMADQAVKDGFLPEVKDAKDHDDAGNVARRDLFGYAAKIGVTDLLSVADVVRDYNLQGKHFVIPEGKEPKDGSWIQERYRALGKDSPVGSTANRTATPSGKQLTYKELHNASMDTLARRAKQKYGIE